MVFEKRGYAALMETVGPVGPVGPVRRLFHPTHRRYAYQTTPSPNGPTRPTRPTAPRAFRGRLAFASARNTGVCAEREAWLERMGTDRYGEKREQGITANACTRDAKTTTLVSLPAHASASGSPASAQGASEAFPEPAWRRGGKKPSAPEH